MRAPTLLAALAVALRRDRRGLAMIEFAFSLPVLLLVVLYGLELANYAVVREQVSQLAALAADNGSRLGVQEVLKNRPITEQQINDLFTGTNLQGGTLDLPRNARVIMSSLETNESGGQWIHWQRCFGSARHPSSYGIEGDGATGGYVSGMGPQGARVKATAANPVIFVELYYEYQPLIFAAYAPSKAITEVAAMIVRDDRDTTRIYNDEKATPATC
jgi:hypothetical protein